MDRKKFIFEVICMITLGALLIIAMMIQAKPEQGDVFIICFMTILCYAFVKIASLYDDVEKKPSPHTKRVEFTLSNSIKPEYKVRHGYRFKCADTDILSKLRTENLKVTNSILH